MRIRLQQRCTRTGRDKAFTAGLFFVLLFVSTTAVRGMPLPQQGGSDAAAAAEQRVDLPATGELRVENPLGGVSVEVWDEPFLSLATVTEGGKGPTRRSPVRMERTDTLLSIKVARAASARTASASRVDLRLRVPASVRLTISTSAGVVIVRGLPASLTAQTVSGDISISIDTEPDASLTAHSLNGRVTFRNELDATTRPVESVRKKFEMRLGAGSREVRLFSGRGAIDIAATLARTVAERASPSATSQARAAQAVAPDDGAGGETAATMTTPRRSGGAPQLVGAASSGGGRTETTRTPAQASPSSPDEPQEVDEDEIVRVETELVKLNFSVIDRASGRGLAGLTVRDFRLFEDGAEQQITHFEAASAPFDLMLLIDLSGSTGKVTGLIRAAALRFVAAARPQDRIGVVTFASATHVVSPLTTDREALRTRINAMEPPNGDTKLYDAVGFAMEQLTAARVPARRQAIVVMSDGLDSTLPNVTGTGSALPYGELRSRVQEFDGVLYALWTSTEYEAFSPLDIQPETFDLVHERMQELAEAGGGVFYDVERLDDLAGTYERVVADLGTVYSLSYRPNNRPRDGRWRAIRVTLPNHPAAAPRGKRGYFSK